MLLRLSGIDVRTAHDGLQALDVAAEFRPDAAMLDLGLPKLNGFDVARRIREQPWGAAMFLVAVTGLGQDEDRRRSDAAGFDHHVVKPLDRKALDEIFRSLRARLG